MHLNLGHPDAQRFVRYLKQGGAGPEILKGAQDFQCEACVESKKGFLAARPAAVHESIAFNTKVGIDLASWKSKQGTEFQFVHVIGEAHSFIWE